MEAIMTPTRRCLISTLALLALLVLAACGDTATPTPVPTPMPAGTPTSGAAPSTGTPGTSGTFRPVAMLETAGGIDGRSTALQISSTGEVRFYEKGEVKGTIQLDSAETARLLEMFGTAGFYNFQDRYDQGNVSDDIYDTITYIGDQGAKVVQVAEVGGKEITPAKLQEIIDALRGIEGRIQ